MHPAFVVPVRRVELERNGHGVESAGHEQVERRKSGEKFGGRNAPGQHFQTIIERLLHKVGLVKEERVVGPCLRDFEGVADCGGKIASRAGDGGHAQSAPAPTERFFLFEAEGQVL